MPLDTRIALGAQPLQLDNPLASYGQAVGIQNVMQQNQLGQMQMAAAQRAAEEEIGAKNYLSGSPDLTTPEGQLGLLKYGKTGLGYAKAIAEQKKALLESDKTAAEVLGLNQKNFTALNPPINAAAGGVPGITAYVEAMYADPVLGKLAAKVKPKEQALAENLAMFQKDPQQWVTAHSNLEGQHLLDALKMQQENAAEAERIASRKPAAPAIPSAMPPVAPAMPAPAPVTREIAPGVKVSPTIGPDGIARINALIGKGTAMSLGPNERWTLSPAGNLISETIPAGEEIAAKTNALAPSAANVNAMNPNVATMQAMADERKRLMDRLNVLSGLKYSKGVEAETKDIQEQLKTLSTPINLRESGTAITPFGTVTAAAAPTEITKLQNEKAAAVAAGNTTAAAQIDAKIAAMTQLQDHRPETLKLYEVIDNPNASQGQKDAATARIAALVHIAPVAVSDFERSLNASALTPAGKEKLRQQWLTTHATHAPPTQINLTQNAEKSYGTAFGGKIADQDAAKYDAATKAPDLAANANRVLASLSDGNVFVGPAATVKLNLARVLNAAGASNDEKIANTETLISNLGRNTLGMVKSSGLGTGQGFTDKDLQFLEKVAGGSIDYNVQTLRNLAELSHKAAEASANTWNKRVKEIPASAIVGTGISTEAVTVPARATKPAAATRPAGVPADWVLHTDAAGKKAYVSPDGKSFKEVP